jgi:hypothetical protein
VPILLTQFYWQRSAAMKRVTSHTNQFPANLIGDQLQQPVNINHMRVLSHLINLQFITSMRMMLNFTHHFLLLTLHTISLILNILYPMSTTGCHRTFFLSIPPRLSFFLLVFLNNSQNSVILSFICQIMSLCHLFILLLI